MKKTLKIFFFFLTLLFSFTSFSQEIHCLPTAEIDEEVKEDLIIAYQDFVKVQKEVGYDKAIFLIDYVKEDSSFYFFSNISVFEIFYKECDCFFVDDDYISYIFTKQYALATDSVWLQNILDETEKLFKIPKLLYSWGDDKFLGFGYSIEEGLLEKEKIKNLNLMFGAGLDDYGPIKYKLRGKKIITKKEVRNMFYPDTKKPDIYIYDRAGAHRSL